MIDKFLTISLLYLFVIAGILIVNILFIMHSAEEID